MSARLPAHYVGDIDRRGNEPEILEGIGDPLLFGDDPAADPQDAEASVGKRNLHHWFGKPGSGAERLCSAANILCRFRVDIARGSPKPIVSNSGRTQHAP